MGGSADCQCPALSGDALDRAAHRDEWRETHAQDGTFLAALSELLQGEDDLLPAFQTAVESAGRLLTEIVRAENTREAARSGNAARAIGSLRSIARLDVRKVFERVSVVDEVLRQDPSGVWRSEWGFRDSDRRRFCGR